MPTSIKNERTRAGCWTCRARRKKCDETRPRCNTCYNLGLKCEGYGFRLKWAPRAKQSLNRSRNNKDMIITMSHSSTECQGDTHPNEVLIYLLGQELYKSITPIQKEIMQDFIDWGAAILIARVKTHYEKYFEVFAGSKALLTSCLAYQITLDSKYAPLAEQYYVRSIEQFRREIANPVCVERESTIYAGLVLCSISMTRGLPWTFHLNGISSILDGRGIAKDQDGHIRDYVFFIGVLDLPTHTLGRRTNHLQIWYRNCRFRFGIEDSLGLPCSLVDLLCLILEPDIEKRLCSWPGEAGTSEQCQIWDLTRYAGIVMAHNLRSEHGLVEESKSDELVAFAVRHIMTTTSRIRAKLGQLSYDPWSGLLFPLVTAGSQPLLLSVADKSLIVESIKDLASGSLERYPYFGKAVSALNELWVNGGGRSLQQVVIDLDMELGLF